MKIWIHSEFYCSVPTCRHAHLTQVSISSLRYKKTPRSPPPQSGCLHFLVEYFASPSRSGGQTLAEILSIHIFLWDKESWTRRLIVLSAFWLKELTLPGEWLDSAVFKCSYTAYHSQRGQDTGHCIYCPLQVRGLSAKNAMPPPMEDRACYNLNFCSESRWRPLCSQARDSGVSVTLSPN